MSTNRSSQQPGTRAPQRATTSKSGSRRDGPASGYRSGEIPYSAATSSTSSRQQETSWQEVDERRKSNVTFAKAPSLAPSDSISKVKTKKSSSRETSARKSSRGTGAAYRSSKSYSYSSTSGGTTQSGSGAPLTENNLERLNSKSSQRGSQLDVIAEGDARPRSDQQEGAKSNRHEFRSSRDTVAQTTNAGRSSRRNTAAAGKESVTEGTDSRSRKDSMSPEGNGAASKGASEETSTMKRSGSLRQSSPNVPSGNDVPAGWERHIFITTKVWDDGREVREKEIKLVRSPN